MFVIRPGLKYVRYTVLIGAVLASTTPWLATTHLWQHDSLSGTTGASRIPPPATREPSKYVAANRVPAGAPHWTQNWNCTHIKPKDLNFLRPYLRAHEW